MYKHFRSEEFKKNILQYAQKVAINIFPVINSTFCKTFLKSTTIPGTFFLLQIFVKKIIKKTETNQKKKRYTHQYLRS